MKLFHLSDLHLGIRVNGFSLISDQSYILDRITDAAYDEKPDCILIAGDVFDKTVPPVEALTLFDSFLVKLSEIGCKVFVISGNHDSPERIAFGGRLIAESGVYLSPVYSGASSPVTLSDEYGNVNIYMLPFVRPSSVRAVFPEEQCVSYSDAVRTAVFRMDIDTSVRNILIAHQFVIGSRRSESEEVSVGGTDGVDVSAFGGFDYTALGHIHRPQSCGSPLIRYCGTPLKYSFSEVGDNKSVTVVELRGKGDTEIREIPLYPLREMRELRGSYDKIMRRSFYENTSYKSDFIRITLTDEEDIPDAAMKLRTVYASLMRLDYDNIRTRGGANSFIPESTEKKTPLEIFGELYERKNGKPMSAEQEAFMRGLISRVWNDGE